MENISTYNNVEKFARKNALSLIILLISVAVFAVTPTLTWLVEIALKDGLFNVTFGEITANLVLLPYTAVHEFLKPVSSPAGIISWSIQAACVYFAFLALYNIIGRKNFYFEAFATVAASAAFTYWAHVGIGGGIQALGGFVFSFVMVISLIVENPKYKLRASVASCLFLLICLYSIGTFLTLYF